MKRTIFTILILLLCFFPKAQNEFITTWKPQNFPNTPLADVPFPSSSTQVWAPFRGNNYTIYWEEVGYPSNNMTINNVTSTNQILLDFGTPFNPVTQHATYRVKVSNGNGNFHRIAFKDDFQNTIGMTKGDASKIIEINQWGSTNWSSMRGSFYGCKNLNMIATDAPNLSNVSDLSHMFGACETLTGNASFNNWNTSTVTTIAEIFSGCYVFNQPIGNWNTSNVQNMRGTFISAQNFNQPIGNWDTSQVVTMENMFNTAKSFNQPIGNWNLSNLQNMKAMFANALEFNQPIGNWNTSNVNTMELMFGFAKAFNQPIGNWNTANVTKMQQMFFGATAFNQPIGSWSTSNVDSMLGMFFTASAFNQNISNWNTSQVTVMQSMFSGASSFNQDLGNWNLSSLLSANGMFFNSALNCQNYDSTLYGWSQNPLTPNNVTISSASPLTYSHPLAIAARNTLINNKGWIITGDVYNPQCESALSAKELTKTQDLNIYPNPTSDFIYIKNLKDAESYEILDISGRIIAQEKLVDNKIDIKNLQKGNYILRIKSKESIKNLKFIKK
ncbi:MULTISPECIES: BspA family leucine-rich repeat surface protein [Chryseobacterium]|uniref:Bacterial surface protein 26-residue repeat n=1 Tax=Chryseobacterium taihuense TaxID=1141221 RepID=A0A4U8WFJ8_9FLAO|nr:MULTISPECIES: BspA family leucine-rich repeat surface protein [Chryseobacterium]QQV01562.1 BspA family leucine-rich repeat surface protein [Chryseobacterium sp. FDAARGOS 1104]VFB05242.1 bacterial surface protein 26-residue repeat [Chryseobacterium taihuense]